MTDPRKKIPKEVLSQFRKVDPLVFETQSKGREGDRLAVTSGLQEYTGPWDDAQVAHLLKRTLFGVRQAELDQFKGMTMSAAVDAIVAASPLPAPPVNNYEIPGTNINDPNVAPGDPWVEAPYDNDVEGYRILSLKAWIIENILNQDTTLHAKMALFWHNLLATQFWETQVSKASYKYYRMLQTQAFGNFRTLIKLLTVDPAMLFYLNGTYNNKDAPDENYARELQELFCIGKGSNANFTESDVQEAAKVLTGWVISAAYFENPGELTSVFYPPWHDTSNKQFSAFYGNTVITGRSGSDGAIETDELLDMIFDTNEVALYICRRLYNFFVYHEIDATTETNVIQPLAQIFRNNNYEIMPVLKTLFKSEHFYDVQNHGAMIKNPADHQLGLWRILEIDVSNFDMYERFYIHHSLIWTQAEVGMEIGDPPSVSGWQAYYQEPTFDRFWINTDTITKKAILQDSLLYWGHWVTENIQLNADMPKFLETLNNPQDPNLLIAECAQLLLGIGLSMEASDGLKAILLSGQSGDFYWTNIWNQYLGDKSNDEYRMTVETRITPMFQALMQLGEFQLM